MNALVEINLNNIQGRQFLQYARTLPFAKVIEPDSLPNSTWQQAIDEGAMTVAEFVGEMKARIEEWPEGVIVRDMSHGKLLTDVLY